MRLAEEYNKSLYFNRKLGETSDRAQEAQIPQSNGGNGSGQRSAQVPDRAPTSPMGQPSSTLLTPDLVTQVNQMLSQGHRLGIEWVDSRRFRTNSWNCYGMFEGNGAEAIAALEACLTDHPSDYVRLVGIGQGDRRRILEQVIHRPS